MRISVYFTSALFALLLVGCAAHLDSDKKQPAKKAASVAVKSDHKMESQFEESRKINNSAIVSQLISKAQQDPTNSEPLYSLGYLHMQNGIKAKNDVEIKLAEDYLTEVIKQFPGNQVVLQALYNIHYDNTLRQRSPDAFEKAKRVFKQLPDTSHANMNPPSLAQFGAVLVQQTQTREPNRQALRELLLNAIQESPTTDTSYIQLARLYREDRYFALALATLKLGAENISNSAELYQTIADTYTDRAEINGCIYEHPSDIQQSSKYYKLAIALSPESPALHYALSESFLDQNLAQLGLHEAKIALELKQTPENININAQNLSLLGFHQQALNQLQQAVGSGLNLSAAGYHEIYMNNGDWKNAAIGFSNYIKTREKPNVYDLIKSDMIAQQANIQPWSISKTISTQTNWEKALLQYWRLRISAEELKEQAHTRCEKTEYYFYTGYRDLIKGDKHQAESKFKSALNQNTYRFIERPLARQFLSTAKP